jgi:Flp pilus assembly protein TadD
VKTLKKAILMEHRDPAVHNNLGLALGRLGRYDEAMSEFQKGGDERAALNNLAYVYYLYGENDKAVELYEQALLVGSDDTVTVIRNLGKAREALFQARAPIATNP